MYAIFNVYCKINKVNQQMNVKVQFKAHKVRHAAPSDFGVCNLVNLCKDVIFYILFVSDKQK